MRRFFFSVCVFACFLPTVLFAQTPICMDYDLSGNRIIRKTCPIISSSPGSESRENTGVEKDLPGLAEEILLKGQIIPNPNNGHFEILLNQPVVVGKFEIFSAQGDLILQQPVGGQTNLFDMPDVPSGNYYLILKSAERVLGQWIILKN